MLISKIYAPKLRGIVNYVRLHNIWYIQDGRWNLCAYQNICVHQKIGAQTLTIWARQNLQLLTSSKSGWRALVQVMLSLLHAVLKWSLHPGRPAYMGGASAVLYRLLYQHDLPKHLRPVQIFAAAYIFTFFLGKIKNLTRLISVLSLHFKFVYNHKSCPNPATTLLSP